MTDELQIALDIVAADAAMSPTDRDDTADVVARIEAMLASWDLPLTQERRIGLTAHSLAFTRRLQSEETLDVDPELFDEVDPTIMPAIREALSPFCTARGKPLHDAEVFLFATHVELART